MFNKIGLKLIFAESIAVIICMAAFAYFSIRSQSKVMLSEIERHTVQQSETIKSATRTGMLTNNRENIYQIIKTIGKQPCIRNVRIYNKQGVIIYAADSSQIGTNVDMKAEACYTCHASDKPLEKLPIGKRSRIFKLPGDSARVFGVINPIYNEPSCWQAPCHVHPREKKVLGVLDLTVCLKPIDDKIESAKINLLIFTILAIVALSLVLWFFVHIWIDKPVNSLLEATQEVAAGNLNYSIPEMGNDELGALARSFNNMTKKLAEARQQLFQSDKLASLGRLAAGVAHEINNPLTGILTYASYLMKRTKNQPEIQEDLAVIVRETKRSREIVKSLLDFARQSVPKKVKADINQIIDRALKVTENQLTISKVKVVKQLANDLPPLTLDPNQMQQVFTNLIVNASHAMGKDGGKIEITSRTISLRPLGVAQIKQALCPKGHNLIDHEEKIKGLPSIKFKIKVNDKEGFMYMDAVYGRRLNRYTLKIPAKAHIDVLCPKCQMSLIDKDHTCPECGSPVFSFETPGKGSFQACTSPTCKWEYWPVVEGEGAKDYVQIKISDTGCGIPKQDLEKIFEPFYSTKGQKGTGLGLAVIWGIVDNHNGTIEVESEVNVGTTFTITLPVQ
ncbi:MAG TPA: sensor histidine kinase [Caldithrix abyssi]|uniref:histidine kinase n=1 Tax=Caldithrix abyssi TaxID=187145 RepID=A0A7V5UFN7_CALAY|nr:sensor histidine kinase [Caldithrix abyssi]